MIKSVPLGTIQPLRQAGNGLSACKVCRLGMHACNTEDGTIQATTQEDDRFVNLALTKADTDQLCTALQTL